jgi:hypothetical protein
MQRRLSTIVTRIYVRVMVEEHIHDMGVSKPSAYVKRRAACLRTPRIGHDAQAEIVAEHAPCLSLIPARCGVEPFPVDGWVKFMIAAAHSALAVSHGAWVARTADRAPGVRVEGSSVRGAAVRTVYVKGTLSWKNGGQEKPNSSCNSRKSRKKDTPRENETVVRYFFFCDAIQHPSLSHNPQ